MLVKVDYINSAIEQIEMLLHEKLLDKNTELLDFGCGQGRLLNGLEYLKVKIIQYMGIDTDEISINWCSYNFV